MHTRADVSMGERNFDLVQARCVGGIRTVTTSSPVEGDERRSEAIWPAAGWTDVEGPQGPATRPSPVLADVPGRKGHRDRS